MSILKAMFIFNGCHIVNINHWNSMSIPSNSSIETLPKMECTQALADDPHLAIAQPPRGAKLNFFKTWKCQT